METCKKEWATERSNGEGIDGKGEGKEKYKEDRQEEWSGGGACWYRFRVRRGGGGWLDCFQGRVIPCRGCVRCQERLAGVMLREKA